MLYTCHHPNACIAALRLDALLRSTGRVSLNCTAGVCVRASAPTLWACSQRSQSIKERRLEQKPCQLQPERHWDDDG
eukprot:1183523-Prorocentrum_minimum.AAC.2